MMQHWLAADWPAPEHIHAGSTLRTGGVSVGQFESLNLAGHVGDDPKNIAHNRQAITQILQLPTTPVWLEQIHGVNVINAQHGASLPADASYSLSKNVVCAVLTADCLPILVCAENSSCVASIHAGWKGLLAGIIENTISLLPESDSLAWFGPAIGASQFEVGNELRHVFLQKSMEFERAFKPLINDKWLANLYCLAEITLNQCGVERIYGGDYCTVSDSQKFFSYRREGQTGRMASLIWMT